LGDWRRIIFGLHGERQQGAEHGGNDHTLEAAA